MKIYSKKSGIWFENEDALKRYLKSSSVSAESLDLVEAYENNGVFWSHDGIPFKMAVTDNDLIEAAKNIDKYISAKLI